MTVNLTIPYHSMCALGAAVAGGFIGNAAYTATKSVYEYAKCRFVEGHFRTVPFTVYTTTTQHSDGTKTRKTSQEDIPVKIVGINRRWDYLAVAVISSVVAVGVISTAGLISSYFLSFFTISAVKSYVITSVIAGSPVAIGTIFVRYLIDQIPELLHHDAAMVVSWEDISASAHPISQASYYHGLHIYNTDNRRWPPFSYDKWIGANDHPLPLLWIDKTAK